MKLIVYIMMTTTLLFSSNLSNLYKMYEKQEYKKACDYGLKYYSKNKKNENYLTLYGLSCLETNELARIAKPMVALTKSADARANASYFGTILLQKQLLFQALIDDKEIYDLHLPQTKFVLSKIFSLFIAKEYKEKEKVYTFLDPEKKELSYKLYIKKNSSKKRSSEHIMVIDIYKDDKFSKRYQYK